MHDKSDISFNMYASKSKFLTIESPGHVSHVQVVCVSVASDIWHRAEFIFFHSVHDLTTYSTQNQKVLNGSHEPVHIILHNQEIACRLREGFR